MQVKTRLLDLFTFHRRKIQLIYVEFYIICTKVFESIASREEIKKNAKFNDGILEINTCLRFLSTFLFV